ncbi:hypothetical protein INT44_002479 [Umbelopsis vinacea]|uniref:Transcription factor domain-containing protein n=1 Tax=Umbelopsis vinacea TaxID=44442 RepID=A0A8H7Q6M3_9FUNG|nr:hypothetical protein INT44_002479 [Umbelopsis vinacea]
MHCSGRRFTMPSKGHNKDDVDQSVLEIQDNVTYLEQQVYELELALREARASLNISPVDTPVKQEQHQFLPSPSSKQTLHSFSDQYISPQFSYDSIMDDSTSPINSISKGEELHTAVTPYHNSSFTDNYIYNTLSDITTSNPNMSASSQSSQDLVLFSQTSSKAADEQKKKDHTWTISMTKEGLTINTNVKTVRDLVSWGLEAIKVLNLDSSIHPFPISFSEYGGNINLSVTSKLLGVHELYAKVLRNGPKPLKFDTGFPPRPPLLAATPYLVIANLLDTYFSCHHKQMQILYQPTFLEDFHNRADAFTSPVIMAVCSYVCLRHCRHMPNYSAQELREMGEFFYSLARELLEDIFDEPDHREETMITLIFIGMFRIQTLRASEACTAFTLAYSITLDLYDERMSMPVVDEQTWIQREMFKRQCFHVTLMEHHVNHLAEKSFKEFKFLFAGENLQPLPDEEPEMVKSIQLKNTFMNWLSNEKMVNARREIYDLDTSDVPGTLSVQKYFEYEEMMIHIWKTLPADFKIVEHPDMDLTDEQVINADRAQLQTFIVVHTWYILLNALFLPKQLFSRVQEEHDPEEGTSSGQTEFANMFVQSIWARSLDRCLKSSLIVIKLAEQQIHHNICRFEPLFLLLVIDLSMRLAKAERQPDIAQIGRQHLERCVNILKASIFAPMHGVLLEEGKTIAHMDYEPPPIAQGLKEQIEKMLMPFGLSV